MGIITWLSEIREEDIVEVGEKAININELADLAVPVPNAFVLTKSAFTKFLKEADLLEAVYESFKNVDHNDILQLNQITAKVKELIEDRDLRSEMAERGRNRASEFSWDKEARKIIKCFDGMEKAS